MKPRRYHGLKRPKLRQTWNKYNLYNFYRMKMRPIGQGDEITFFQQKWRAKGMMRTYHGEHIVERKWTRMFSRRLLGAAQLDPGYMARNDGSELADGRGSGKDVEPREWEEDELEQKERTPYMQMTFAPMERRLDVAVFRAMFASSARQARQFCVHGAVKVNGKVVPYPAYRLNPGDMFQVDPERVLYATGRPKLPAPPPHSSKGAASTETEEAAEATEEAEEENAEKPEEGAETAEAPESSRSSLPLREQVQTTLRDARYLLTLQPGLMWHKMKARRFINNTKYLLKRAGHPEPTTPEDITKGINALVAEVNKESAPTDDATPATAEEPEKIEHLSVAEREALLDIMHDRLRELEENPYDPSKPYATPWYPRRFMAPFAFIPRYLEVNQNICSAVYLRHPVARVGSAEVPTPFPPSHGQLAFNWYLRRR